MQADKARKSAKWAAATRHLRRVDPKLADIIKQVGPCLLSPRKDYFVALCKSIYNQQLSTRVAAVLFKRFRSHFPRQRPTPSLVAALLREPEALKRCGLSRQKAVYLAELANHFHSGQARTRRLATMDDEQIIEALTCVKGVGRWTVEMFLIFVLNRPDVLPVDDLGLREAIREIFDLSERPTAKELTAIAEPWRPYRSIATWYLWRGLTLARAKSSKKPASAKKKRRKRG